MERWAVGGLCAERLETQVAADSSAFLMCESARNMERMLFWVDDDIDRKSTRLNSSHSGESRMPSSA